ncbi:MAG: GtrA family protein [Ruminococcus sp.]|nr:GtrA family protein [Ruminococcus sp.]
MKKFIEACVSILPKPLRDIYYKYEEKWLYLFFGFLTTAVSFITAGVSKSLLESAGMGSGAVGDISTAISWVCAVTFAYLTNRVWVFESNVSGAKAFMKEAASFYGGRVFTFFTEIIMMRIGYSWLGFNYWVVKIAANVVVLILNYIISKIFVFRNKDAAAVKNENE